MTKEEAKQVLGERRPVLLSVALRIVRASSTAPEDVVQEAYLKALRAVEAGNFPGERDHLLAWFVKIVHNAAYDALRRHLRRQRRRAGFPDLEPADCRPGPLDELLGREEDSEMKQSLALLPSFIGQLPPEERRVIELRLQGLPYRRIADILGIPPGSISALFRTVCDKLRKGLESGGLR